MPRILLADDHEMVRRGLRALLEAQPGWQVIGEARTGREAVALAAELRPDIAILDLMLPELNGLAATRRILRELPGTAVLIFTMHHSEQLLREAFLAGARGYVLKSNAAEQLVAAVAAAARRPVVPDQVSGVVRDAFPRRRPAGGAAGTPRPLSPREREIVQLLAEGRGNKAIAEMLAISAKTVETHRAAIMRKLSFGSLAELVRYAIRNHLVES